MQRIAIQRSDIVGIDAFADMATEQGGEFGFVRRQHIRQFKQAD